MLSNRKKNLSFLLKDSADEGSDSDGSSALSAANILNLCVLSEEKLAQYLLNSFTQKRRNTGQKKFGPVPCTEDPNHFLTSKKYSFNSHGGESPRQHPLLCRSQQFSGYDPKLTALPIENTKAKERFSELRLENQLRNTHRLNRQRNVTLSR